MSEMGQYSQKIQANSSAAGKASNSSNGQSLNHAQEAIGPWLKKVRFRRCILGVSEADVWKKIGELNALYEAALSAERARFDALLEESRKEKPHAEPDDFL